VVPRFEGCFLAAAFDFTMRNRLGGRAEADDGTELGLGHDADGTRYLRAGPAEGDSAALTITLFDSAPDEDTVHYLDGRQFDRLVLTVRTRGPVSAHLRDASDRTTEISIDDTANEWRRVEIPVSGDGIHEHHLARLKLSGGSFEIDRVDLCRGAAQPAETAANTTHAGRSLWVWHTSDLLRDGPPAIAELVDLAHATRIERIHLQLPSGLDEPDTRAAVAATIGALETAGLEVFALDGAPEYGSADGRRTLQRALDRVLAHNAAVEPAGRFAGVHLDVEPYLSAEWSDDRDAAIQAYLVMLEEASEQLDELPLDAAVPFWFDGIQLHEQTDAGVESTSLLRAVLERADEITVMDYRTRSDGSNGILALAAAELTAAAEAGKQVWVGLETTWLPDETLIRFRGVALEGLPAPGERDWWVVEANGELLAVPDARIEEVADTLTSSGTIRHWAAYAVEVPASRQTFHDLGYAALDQTLEQANASLEGHPAFAGFALHYDRPLRRLLDGDR
jgi:hypothetical protein